jgi:hypothetical protein
MLALIGSCIGSYRPGLSVGHNLTVRPDADGRGPSLLTRLPSPRPTPPSGASPPARLAAPRPPVAAQATREALWLLGIEPPPRNIASVWSWAPRCSISPRTGSRSWGIRPARSIRAARRTARSWSSASSSASRPARAATRRSAGPPPRARRSLSRGRRQTAASRSSSAARSSGLGVQRAAAALARTCSGVVAPAITEDTTGRASSAPIATSSSDRPRSRA